MNAQDVSDVWGLATLFGFPMLAALLVLTIHKIFTGE